MIRPTTLAMLLLAASAGGLLFRVSFEVAELEDRLGGLNRAIVKEQESIHVLRAEWSYLNQPSQLAALAERYLDLVPLATEQIQTFAALPLRPLPETLDDDEITADAATLLAEVKGLPKLKPLAPRRHVRARQETVSRPEVAAIFVTQPAPSRTLGDVLNDVMKPSPVRVE